MAGGRILQREVRAAILAVLLLAALPSAAQEAPLDNLVGGDQPVLLSADELTYDQANGITVAAGNVEITQNDRTVLADRVIYNERSQEIVAEGNVSLVETSGDVLFADRIVLTDDLREGAIESIRLLLADQSRMAAASGQRSEGRYIDLNKAVYSPCALCPTDRDAAPLWQIKAVRVTHDQVEKRIEYRDAWLEIYGVPIAYTPYFSHPDPTVERQSGFLSPQFGGSDQVGAIFQIPYFWAIDVDEDLTFAPMFTTEQSVVPVLEYRKRFVDGEINLGGSFTIADRETVESGVTHVENNVFRGHVDALGRFDINDEWRAGFDIQRATDKTYQRLYDLGSERTLTSRLFAEGFHGRNYLSLAAYSYQGLRDIDVNDEAPIITPLIDYNFVGEPSRFGGYYNLDFNAMALTRIEGRDSRRLSLGVGWTLPYVAPAGDIYKLSASVRGDVYWFDDVDPFSNDVNPTTDTEDGVRARIFPQFAFEWRYPFARHTGNSHQVLEPIFGLYAGVGGGNNGEIPNEDSLQTELDDTDIFNPNRFNGLDRVDDGQRVDYGLRWSIIGDRGGYSSFFIGQSVRLGGGDEFGSSSGVSDTVSDLVGRVQISPTKYFDLIYRFRFDVNDGVAERNEVGLRLGPPALMLTGSYAQVDSEPNGLGRREELAGTLSSQVTDYWRAYVTARHDLVASKFLQLGGGISYQDECFGMAASVTRSEFRDEENDPDTKFLFTVSFKNLGEVGLPF